jgi:HEAT repeat protein
MTIRCILLAALLTVLPSCATSAPPNNLTQQLINGTTGAKTSAEFEAAYTQVLPSLITKPQSDDVALQQLVFHASRPDAETERAALATVLATRLSAGGPVPLKVLLLRHIQRIGREETLPAVLAALSDQDAQVRECARRALANNPTQAAADALRTAIQKADDNTTQGALLSALAFRRDQADTPLFIQAAQNSDDAVRLPAIDALARIGDLSAAPVLAAACNTGSDAAKAAANDAYLLLADRLTQDHRADAARIYRQYLFSPYRYRCAAIIGLGSAGTEEDTPKFLNLLADKDPQARGAALAALALRHDPGTGNEILTRLAKADASLKPWLLRALIDQNDPHVKQALLTAATDTNAAVRLQAISSLAHLGDASSIPALLTSATAKGEEQVAARDALDQIPGKSVDDALLERAAKGQPAIRVEVLRALAARRTAGAIDPLFTAAQDPDSAVRSQALKSLAQIAEFDTLPRALTLLIQAKEDSDRDQAAKTIVAIARKNDNTQTRIEPILTQTAQAQGPLRAALLNILGQLGGPKALQAIRSAVKSNDKQAHEAGVRALTNWPDDTPLNDLLTLAKEDKNNTLSILSLRAYIRIAGLPTKRPAPETVRLFQTALNQAKRPEEKKMSLGGLGEIKDAKALEAVLPYLNDNALTGEASAAAIKISKAIWEKNKDLAKTAMTKVVEVTKTENQKKAAKDLLQKIADSTSKKPM